MRFRSALAVHAHLEVFEDITDAEVKVSFFLHDEISNTVTKKSQIIEV